MAIPFISVLVDTYNQEPFIEEAVQSVLDQDFPASEMEILAVDDGSTDRTAEIVRRFGPRVRLLQKQNGGQASAFNAGIPLARGEIVAFLDGDDWWASRKLAAVAQVFSANPDVGLVGHGITNVYSDGRQCAESLRESCRFRIATREDAKRFCTRRVFLGTSRMAYRKEVLCQIGQVPLGLEFEADEYLFTLAGLLADVLILQEPLTFYRLHDKNLFQLSNGTPQGIRRKQRVLGILAESLRMKLREDHVAADITRILVECVQTEADLLRLVADSGFPWETVTTELKIQRIFHNDASLWQHLFSYLRLVPALVMPSASYYRWRYWFSSQSFYRNLRKRFFPFPVPSHVQRDEKSTFKGQI